MVSYEPEANYSGTDVLTIEVTFASGALSKRRYSLTVNPAINAEANPSGPKLPIPASLTEPRTFEFARVAASGQKLLVAFLVDLNPDCSSIGYATVRVIEQAKHGKVTVENTIGFSAFPQENLRYECNKRKTDGVLVSYLPDASFKGAESFTFDVILPDGNFNRRHFAVDVR